MEMTEDRKFKLTVCCILTFVVLLCTDNVTPGDFITLVSLTFGTFVLGNVAGKFAPKKE